MVATQVLMLRQETEPTWLMVSDGTVDQELPSSLVPASASFEPAPAAQQFCVLAQEIELNQSLSVRPSTCAQAAPASGEASTTDVLGGMAPDVLGGT